MHIVYIFMFIMAFISFPLCFSCSVYYDIKCRFYFKKHFPDFGKGFSGGWHAFHNTKKFRDYLLEKGVTTETTTLKMYVYQERMCFLLAMISLILLWIFAHLSQMI